ncbi:MAG: ATP-binding protein [Planctomycetota bacterium]|nr:MAG: ATP-binding protein [Planctomycetota bacterium]
MYHERIITGRLQAALAAVPVVVVVGARQVGKSTLMRHLRPQAAAVTFDPVQDIAQARSDPDLFLASQPRPLILDEIQYVPDLVAAVKRAVDRDRSPGQYLITGSQQWQVMARLTESLAGRALILDLEGFTIGEIASQAQTWLPQWLDDPKAPPAGLVPPPYSFAEQLWRGFLPEAQTLPAQLISDFHRSYQATYVERDVRQMAALSDWGLFGRFVRLLSALTAQEINRAQLGRELGINPQTAAAWVETLRATCQWHEVEPFHGNTLKRLSRKPKGYAADSGQVCASLAIPSPQALVDHPSWGAIVETALVGDIRRQTQIMATRPQISHWRSHGGAEVDLILAYNGRLHPIEMKGNSHPTRADMRGITAWRSTYPDHAQDPALILAPVAAAYQIADTCWVIPWNATVAHPTDQNPV